MTAPEFHLYDHQNLLELDMARLAELASSAFFLVIKSPGPEVPVLGQLPEVEVSFITDAAISKVHAEFLGDPTPTDVITFAHGEILISTETARLQAEEHGMTPAQEVALYLIHGLLHLNGHEDESEEGFARMKHLQEEILTEIWPPENGAFLSGR